MAVTRTRCGSDELELLEDLDDGRKRLRCSTCGNEWLKGQAKHVYKTTKTFDDLKGKFPSPTDVTPEARERASRLKARYLAGHPKPDPRAESFRETYREVFSRDGIASATPDQLKYFANANVAGNPGNMSMFNEGWNLIGDEEASRRMRESVEYLLYAEDGSYIEDRLTNLIKGKHGFGMKGFREALLTKV